MRQNVSVEAKILSKYSRSCIIMRIALLRLLAACIGCVFNVARYRQQTDPDMDETVLSRVGTANLAVRRVCDSRDRRRHGHFFHANRCVPTMHKVKTKATSRATRSTTTIDRGMRMQERNKYYDR